MCLRLAPRTVVGAPPRCEQVARTQVGLGPVEERPGVVDHAWRRRWVPEQAVQPFHEDRDPGAPLRRPRVAGQHVEDDRRRALGGGRDHVLRHHGVVAPGELGRPGGVGGRSQDVAHLRRVRQRMQVCGRSRISGSARCVPGGFGRRVPGCAVGVGRGGPLQARTGRPLGEDSRGVRAAAARRSSGQSFWKMTRAGSAHATAYPAIARSSSIVNAKSPERVCIFSSFAQRAGRLPRHRTPASSGPAIVSRPSSLTCSSQSRNRQASVCRWSATCVAGDAEVQWDGPAIVVSTVGQWSATMKPSPSRLGVPWRTSSELPSASR